MTSGRYNMDVMYILFLSIGLMTVVVTSTQTTLRYYKDGRTWNEAQTICSNNNGKLMIPDASTMGQLNQTCPIAMNETIWVGEYTSLSEWIEIIGCYGDWDTNSNIQYLANDPLLCVHLCQNYTYFGMKNEKCICIDQGEYNTVTKIDSRNCINRQITEEPKTNCTRIDCFCVSVDCQTIGNQLQTAYFSRPCSNDLTTVCGNYESLTGDAPSWKEAIQRCVEQQNSYPVNSDLSISVCNKTAITWTSIFRDVFVATDKTGLPLSNIQGCKQMDLTKSSSSVLKPGQSEDFCVPTTTPATTTEPMTSTTSDMTTTTTEQTSSGASSQDMSTSLSSSTTQTQTFVIPPAGPSAQIGPGNVIGFSVVAVIIVVGIVCTIVLLVRRKCKKDNESKETSSLVNPYLTIPEVGNSNPNMNKMTEITDPSIVNKRYQNYEMLVPVDPEALVMESHVPKNEPTGLTEETIILQENSNNEENESKNERTTIVSNGRDHGVINNDKNVKKNVFHEETVNDVKTTNTMSAYNIESINNVNKDDKAETINTGTTKQTSDKHNENTTPSTTGGAEKSHVTTLGGAEKSDVTTIENDKTVPVKTTESAKTSNMITIGNVGPSDVTTIEGTGSSRVTTTEGAGQSHVTTIGGAGPSHVTTTSGARPSHVTTIGGAGPSHVTTIGGAGPSHVTTIGGAGPSHVTKIGGAIQSHVTTVRGAGPKHVTTIGGIGKSDSTTKDAGTSQAATEVAETGQVTTIEGIGKNQVTALSVGKQQNINDNVTDTVNADVVVRNKPSNDNMSTPGSHTSVINIKM
ncbi:hypothetical protein KUTeg_015203 [Tegillarca granosa]|uniref:Uncharacterized protein n=1 Tax=Tegillarca granosa TaxID=220873 RepID=A0ABQ9EPH2_TEGGR|nr:hypothetical protein KUTeg_015203 [Tegillarca granosa]